MFYETTACWIHVLVCEFRDLVIVSSIPGPSSADLQSIKMEKAITEESELRMRRVIQRDS